MVPSLLSGYVNLANDQCALNGVCHRAQEEYQVLVERTGSKMPTVITNFPQSVTALTKLDLLIRCLPPTRWFPVDNGLLHPAVSRTQASELSLRGSPLLGKQQTPRPTNILLRISKNRPTSSSEADGHRLAPSLPSYDKHI